jgi:hypothetical protein
VRACQTNEFPDDDDLNLAFGFRHFVSASDRLRLFALYRLMVEEFGVDDEELRQAWHTNSLKEFLLFRGSQSSDVQMQSELRWLRQQSGFATGSNADFASAIDKSARRCLSTADQKKWIYQLEPLKKRQAFLFYGQILNGYVPDIDEDLWIGLGFCTTKNVQGRSSLFGAYRAVIDRCSFEEFWTAMRDSAMAELFQRNGQRAYTAATPTFTTFMKNIARWHQSVWELKKYTMSMDVIPQRSVQVDYGFANCEDAVERMALKTLYAEYFARDEDELLLHEKCIEGQLAPLLKSIIGPLPIPEDRLRNPYPLAPIPGIVYMRYDGLVFKKVVSCAASDYEMVCRQVKRDGQQVFVLPDPDDADQGMRASMKSQAAHTTGRLYTSRRVFEGKVIESFYVSR